MGKGESYSPGTLFSCICTEPYRNRWRRQLRLAWLKLRTHSSLTNKVGGNEINVPYGLYRWTTVTNYEQSLFCEIKKKFAQQAMRKKLQRTECKSDDERLRKAGQSCSLMFDVCRFPNVLRASLEKFIITFQFTYVANLESVEIWIRISD
jgi:hypothetical protein